MYGLERRDIVPAFGNAYKCQLRALPQAGLEHSRIDSIYPSLPSRDKPDYSGEKDLYCEFRRRSSLFVIFFT